MSSTLKGAIQSMTGYGRAVKRTAIGSIAVELRSTNHRYLEIEQHLPSGLTALQGRLSELIRSHIRRGRIETFVSVQLSSENQRAVTFDETNPCCSATTQRLSS
ncbi:MAG: hypothetical protein HYY58_03300 [Candidatus Omnitrophica bacterium]|nr:hypothetical protein [Candidatus Omnitrophota bacterium]